MRKIVLGLCVLLVALVVADSAFAKTEKIIEKRNEFGGETEEEAYSPGDDKYKDGIAKLVEYYDGNKRILKMETYFTPEHSLKDGIQKSVQYYDNRFYTIGKRTRVEFYYTDDYAGREGIFKSIKYYDEDEDITKVEYFYTDDYAKRKVVSRMELLYDDDKPSKKVFYDKYGKVLSTEKVKD